MSVVAIVYTMVIAAYKGSLPTFETATARRNREATMEGSMIQAKRIGHATFTTADLDRVIEHYQDVVGLHVVSRDSKSAYLATNAGQLAVVLEKGSDAECKKIAFE